MNHEHDFEIDSIKYRVNYTDLQFTLTTFNDVGYTSRSTDLYNLNDEKANIWGSTPQKAINYIRKYYLLKAFW